MSPVAESKEARHNTETKTLPDAAHGPGWGRYEPGLGRELAYYLTPLSGWWSTIAVLTFVGTVGGWAASHLFLAKWYRAEAIIRPMTAQETIGMMQGYTVGAGGGVFNNVIGSEYNASVAEQDITILRSYTFLTNLARKHKLETLLLEDVQLPRDAHKSWVIYRMLRSRSTARYSVKTGNVSLTYLDKNRKRAQKILEWEIKDLRRILRAREVRNAAAAASSLEQQVRNVSDALLARQLYELIARQIQREKIAEVQADFAFEVLQPAVVPDRPALPHNARNGLLVGFIAFCAVCGSIVFWNLIRPAGPATGSEAEAERG